MKRFILELKKARHAYLFTALGILLIVFPNQIGDAAPYIVGAAALLYAFVNLLVCLKFPEAGLSLGDSVVKAVIGLVSLMLKDKAISVLGVIWAVVSLHEVADEIDEYYKTKNISLLSVGSIIVTIVFAAMLMMDPFDHFNTHLRILGLEMVAASFIRRRHIFH